ncbi:MAG: hypothetical protein AAFY36_17915 [Bacteroidota bacterium]
MNTYQLEKKDRQRRFSALLKTGLVAILLVSLVFGWDFLEAILSFFQEPEVVEQAGA